METISVNENYRERYGFHDAEVAVFKTQKGLTRETVEEISEVKGEPPWMLELRLKAYETFLKKPMPNWGADLSAIDFDNMTYYIKPSERKGTKWEDIPPEIKRTFDKLGNSLGVLARSMRVR